MPSDTSLPDELNAFYACFEASNTEPCMRAPAVPDDCVISLFIADVSKIFKQVNIVVGLINDETAYWEEVRDQL